MNQTEKLEFQPVTRHFIEDALDAPPVSNRGTFTMPSIHRIRAHDARLSARMASRDSGGDFLTIRDEDGNEERHETACFLPSARNRGAVYSELRGMGFAWNE